jgi:hypothetical protein
MITFKNVTDFINHYAFKKTIPPKVSIIINGKKHIFDRGGKSKYTMQLRPLDSYELTEIDYTNGTTLGLTVNFVRFFEHKYIVEAFFIFKNKEKENFLSPIYFFDSFATTDILINCLPEDIQSFFGMEWVAFGKLPEEFVQIRKNAYEEANKELYYLHLATVESIKKEYEFKSITGARRRDFYWEDKWDVDRQGNSPYFDGPVKPPEIYRIW